MTAASAIDRYAVIGNPIKHSKSPQIHRLFAQQAGQQLSYEPLLGPVGKFNSSVAEFVAEGGRGVNVTVPFKHDAFELASTLSKRAQRAGAVNTLSWDANSATWAGDNTDGVGLLKDLTGNLNIELAGKRVLVLGAGGAVRGVLGPLLDASPAEVHVANRTAEKANQLAAIFDADGSISGGGWGSLEGRKFDVIINGTAASLAGELPPLPELLLAAGGIGYDMMYGAKPTLFMEWVTEHQGRAFDGLGMLVEQAAESFNIWRGVMPATVPVIEQLRNELVAS